MKNYSTLCLILIALLFAVKHVNAIPATPYPITITQPDGSVLTIRLRGDEFFKYKSTVDGYTLIPNNDGILTYAKLDANGVLVSTDVKASDIEKRTSIEKQALKTLVPNLDFAQQTSISRSKRLAASASKSPIQKTYPLTGSPKSLVILVNFSNKSFVTSTPKTAFTNLLNQNGYNTNGGTGSANNYFKDNSMGAFSPQFDVVGPFTLPGTMESYGANTSSGDDTDPQQMVIDACTLAYNSGVNFAQYDTDSDGIVDNVFIYYAGYNEAEGGPANSIWPHRWSLNDYSTKFNGVAVFDYACTSELRSASGSNMCGIGTFCHEFGHVLGLDDMYATSSTATHHTLSTWDIMDYGPYLNSGRTPCSYSAYERFYLNWLTPTEIKTAADLSLDTLTTSNKAYLISQTGNHNLDGKNPSPVEFFLLENRQKKGWDAYLPGHGMLITHVYYNATTWANNTPNNDPYAMGVDIVEADGIALSETTSIDQTDAGDPFPGTSNVTAYSPMLRSGTALLKPLTSIKETLGHISFKFMGGNVTIVPPVAENATDTTYTSFVANWNPVKDATGYYLTVYNISNEASTLTEDFANGLVASPDWTITPTTISSSVNYSGVKPPAIQFANSNEFVETEEYILPPSKLSFYAQSLTGKNGGLKVEGQNEQKNWIKVDSIAVTSSLKETKAYSFDSSHEFYRFRFTYTKGSGYLIFDDVSAEFAKKVNYVLRENWLTNTSDTISNITPNTVYYYKVKASDKNESYENITAFSNLITVKTLEYPSESRLQTKISSGNITVYLPTIKYNLYVYNLLGQCMKIVTPESTTFDVNDLPKNQVYILKSNNLVAKIAL